MKFSVFSSAVDESNVEPRLLIDGELSGIGEENFHFKMEDGQGSSLSPKHPGGQARDSADAMAIVFNAVSEPELPVLDAVGYRVVHPGPNLKDHQVVTPEVMRELDAASDFAPLHDPAALVAIREGQRRFPNIGHYACFDTTFHRTLPEEAFTYPLAAEIRQQGVRRYGFHGLSCESVVRSLRRNAALPHRTVIAHLGSGCSVTAVVDGESIDTTMGMTPTGGVVMGTRSGDLDPGLLLYLLRKQEVSMNAANAVESLLNHSSGLVGLTGLPNDMQLIRQAAALHQASAVLALKIFTRSIRKAIGAFSWLMGGLDGVVFTGGIGEHDADTRLAIVDGLHQMGIELDAEKNAHAENALRSVSSNGSKTDILVVPAQEDLMIAVHVTRMSRSTL